MRIRTQNLADSFSSSNKKQKAVLPPNCALGKRFGENDLVESNDRSAVAVKARKIHTVGRNFG
jgi:hypothetical protein